MQFILDEEQTLLADTARRFVDEHAPLEHFRALRDRAGGDGYSPELWAKMAEMGWQALLFPEEVGGFDLGMTEFVLIMEALGRNLAGEPFVPCVLLAGGCLQAATNLSLSDKWLPRIASGDAIATVAFTERSSRYHRTSCTTQARESAQGFIVSGEKSAVLNAASADLLIVLARTEGSQNERGGLILLAVDPKAPGVTITPHMRVDHRGAATVTFTDVEVPMEKLVSNTAHTSEILDAVFDRALVGLSAEMLGSAAKAFEITLAYMRERKQFGVTISTFQALQHRMALVFTQIEMARSAVAAAARAVDAGSAEASKLASLAKAKTGQALELAAKEGIQMHGGVGMTDEYDIGFFLKRARGAEVTLGDQAWHRARWAALSGY
jgi:alkylation response protein AidB-like acyl-CoA dehydrogenase